EIVASYSSTENISRNNTTFNVAISSLYGSGDMSIKFTWDASSITDHTGSQIVPDVTVVLKDQSGQTMTSNVDKSKVAQGEVVVSASALPSGSYFLNISVKKDTTYYYGYTEVVRVSGADVSASVDFAQLGSGNINSAFNLSDTTSAPITATLAVTEVEGATTVEIVYDNLPVGKTSNDVTVQFYVDDYEMTTTKNAEGKYPLGGFFGKGRITAILNIPGLKGSMGSASLVYEKP
ncbi:MAG: hypothetical protein ACI4S4_03255, partial [Candidatus Ornithospirochaeta sp.]